MDDGSTSNSTHPPTLEEMLETLITHLGWAPLSVRVPGTLERIMVHIPDLRSVWPGADQGRDELEVPRDSKVGR